MSVPIDEWRMNKKISNHQKQVLDSLVCERLSSDEQNLRLVDGFCNYKNPALADVIHFHDNNERAVAKPVYDFSCKFMYQEVSPLPMLQKEFFDNFNSEY